MSLELTSAQAFTKDVIRGERTTSALLGERGMTLRYFRHPFLHMGSDLDTRRGVEQFLADRGYTISPVTIDPQDWAFARVYANAARRGEQAKMRHVIDLYLAHAARALAWSEAVSADLLGYEVKQVLLLHANMLNADCFDELAALWQRRCYRVIRLEEALRDPAYAQADTFVGPDGASWLYHWANTQGRRIQKGPRLPASIVAALYAGSRGAASGPAHTSCSVAWKGVGARVISAAPRSSGQS